MTKKQSKKQSDSKDKLNIIAVASITLSLVQWVTYINMATYYSFEEFDKSIFMSILFLTFTCLNIGAVIGIYKLYKKQRHNEVTVSKALFWVSLFLFVVLYVPLNIILK